MATKYHQFIEGYDTLKEGQKIRLAGRTGVIESIDKDYNDEPDWQYDVCWDDDSDSDTMILRKFIMLEVEDKPIIMPFPLKAEIVKAVKAKSKEDFIAWIDAFPEKDSDVKV